MSAYEEIVKKRVDRLREDYSMGNYCGRSLFSIIEKIKLDDNKSINLFRLPFKENNVSGFVGYKNDQFVIFTNTSKNLGYEIFTLAHEIYHLLENESIIKSEVALNESEENRDLSDDIADMFAAELLMPKDSFNADLNRLMSEDSLQVPDIKLIVELQHEYYVEYKEVTKRLRELNLIDSDLEYSLNEILKNEKEIKNITKKLGYSNELNEPSRAVHLPKRFLKAIEENYRNNKINYDDLIVVFGYCNLMPEDFGYEEDELLSEAAKSLLEKLNKQLGSD